MVSAPAVRASRIAISATPPDPRISTLSPGRTGRSPKSALHAVTPAQGRVAASASVRWSGTRRTPRDGNTRCVARTPRRAARQGAPPRGPRGGRAALPVLEEAWRHPVAGLQVRHPGAGFPDDADPVRQRDKGRLHAPPVLAAQDDQIALGHRLINSQPGCVWLPFLMRARKLASCFSYLVAIAL